MLGVVSPDAESPLGLFCVLDTNSLHGLLLHFDGASVVRLAACRCDKGLEDCVSVRRAITHTPTPGPLLTQRAP